MRIPSTSWRMQLLRGLPHDRVLWLVLLVLLRWLLRPKVLSPRLVVL
jgi:hypothetical protein